MTVKIDKEDKTTLFEILELAIGTYDFHGLPQEKAIAEKYRARLANDCEDEPSCFACGGPVSACDCAGEGTV